MPPIGFFEALLTTLTSNSIIMCRGAIYQLALSHNKLVPSCARHNLSDCTLLLPACTVYLRNFLCRNLLRVTDIASKQSRTRPCLYNNIGPLAQSQKLGLNRAVTPKILTIWRFKYIFTYHAHTPFQLENLGAYSRPQPSIYYI